MNAQSIEPTYDEQAKDELQNSFDLFSYYVAEQLDPNYKPISFKDPVDAEEAKRIEDFVQNRIYATYTTMNQDSNFYYKAEYQGKTITSADHFSANNWTLLKIMKIHGSKTRFIQRSRGILETSGPKHTDP